MWKIKADTKAYFAREKTLLRDCILYALGPEEFANIRDEEEQLPS